MFTENAFLVVLLVVPSLVQGINWHSRGHVNLTLGSELRNIHTTCHSANEQGACALPNGDFSVYHPVALGDIPELRHLRFDSDLCGHVLRVNCGRGDLDIIVTNSNLGGGLDLYLSSWNRATGNRSPGVAKCSVQLTSMNTYRNQGPRCYYIEGEGYNAWYHNVALFNTGSRIVTGAHLKGRPGSHRGGNPFYAFDVHSDGNDKVTFKLNDGSSESFVLRDCIRGVAAKKNWH